MQLRPDTTDEQVFHETFVKQFHVPPEEIRPATVLDLGCSIGLTVAHFEVLWPNAEIIGVDLDSENCVVAAEIAGGVGFSTSPFPRPRAGRGTPATKRGVFA